MELYFIGYALSEEEKKPVDELRTRIAEQFDVHAAMKMPPHITIVRPFETERSGALAANMRALAEQEKSFDVPVKKFGSSEKSKVWYLEPEQSQGLMDLKRVFRQAAMEVWKLEQIGPEFESHFHVTLSYRDVAPAVHKKIGAMLKGEPLPLQSLHVNSISLFKHRGTGQGWEVVETFQFGA